MLGNKDESQLKALKVSQELHHRKVNNFFTTIAEVSEQKAVDVLAICFDYEKNLPLPVTNVSIEYYYRQL